MPEKSWKDLINEDVIASRLLGVSYGQYKAMSYDPEQQPIKAPQPPKKKKSMKTYSEEEAFCLWQQGLTDAEIGAAVGVSRTIIQRWRDVLELPSTAKAVVDTKKFRLEINQDGNYIVLQKEEDL